MMRINNVLQIHAIKWEHFHFFWTILIYLKVSISSVHKILPLQRVIMVDTVNILRQMEQNANLGISDFYLVEDGEGKLDWTGTMDLCRVLEIVRKKVFEQKSCDLSAWVPVKPLPSLPAALALAHHHMMKCHQMMLCHHMMMCHHMIKCHCIKKRHQRCR